jgi:hypothetical protein
VAASYVLEVILNAFAPVWIAGSPQSRRNGKGAHTKTPRQIWRGVVEFTDAVAQQPLVPVALVLGASAPDPVVELLRPLSVAFRLALLVFGLLMLEPTPVWLVPAVGLLFSDRLLPVAAPGTAELHG